MVPLRYKQVVRNLIKKFKYTYRYFKLLRTVKNNTQVKVILGAAETYQNGWYSTNEQWLDISNKDDWNRLFKGKKLLGAACAEHVFEHLSYSQCQAALKHIARHMIEGGHLRIAIPDGYHPNDTYIKHIGINGIGDDAADHKQLLNTDTLSALFIEAGFIPSLVEGYDNTGVLVQNSYNDEDGYIMRSRKHPSQLAIQTNFPDSETSLIMDGVLRKGH
jgi:predicted SAM-dependent methyltransferase